MRDSATYQRVLAEGEVKGRTERRTEGRTEGRIKGEKRLLLILGQQRFGPPNDRARRALVAMTNVERIERIGTRLLQAASWDDLLSTP